jgi:Tfp pilus assembly PilM family ATPase
MSRFLALEWDNREARVAVASAKGAGVLVERLLSVPLPGRDKDKDKEKEEGRSPDLQIGEAIGAALDAAGIRRADALVSVGRASIELKQLSFPPVPDEELPEMVRWQAMREFHSLGEDWPLDYLPLASSAEGNRTVMAAALSPEMVRQFQETCSKADLEARKMILRPVAAASLFLRSADAAQEEVRLLVDLVSEEVDLTVLVGRDPVFMRTARLPHEVTHSPENFKAPFPELRRTMAAAHNQLAGRKVQAIYLCGTQEEHGDLAQRMQADLGLPVRVFDPLKGLELSASLKSARPANSGRFAPLLGMLADEISNVPHGIDFLHPHKAPAPPSKRNTYVLAVAAAAAVVLLGAAITWQRLAALDQRIVTLTAESKGLDEQVKEAAAVEKSVAEIRQWTDGDILWLEELKELSERFPESKEAMLTNLRLSPHAEGGVISLDGLVGEPSTIDSLEQALRDEFHSVEGKGRTQDASNKKYGWTFKSAVIVKPQDKAKKTATASAAKTQANRLPSSRR